MSARERPIGNSERVIAFCGTRGLPANYGGFETAVHEISRRLVDAGVACEVFCRMSSSETQCAEHDGRTLRYVRGSSRRTFDTFVSSVETGWELILNRKRYGHVFWFNNANLPGILLTRLAGISMSVNTDGLEWRRAKWRWPFKAYYFASSFLISRVCPTLISDSRAIQQHYSKWFFKTTAFIPYGVPNAPIVSVSREQEILDTWGLKRGRYLLQVTRVEPDNLPVEIAEGFSSSGLSERGYSMLSIGYHGSTPYADQLMRYDGRSGIRVRKAVYDLEVLHVLRTNCYAYVHGNSVGGTNPALLEAMNACPRVIAIDCEFSREVLCDTGWFFRRESLAGDLGAIIGRSERGSEMKKRIEKHYQWSAVATSYAQLAGSTASESIVREGEEVALESH